MWNIASLILRSCVLGLLALGLACAHIPRTSSDSQSSGRIVVSGRLPGASPYRPGTRINELYGKLPLSFEANTGQTDPQVDFISHGRGHALFLTSREAVLALRAGDATGSGGGSSTGMQTTAVLRIQVVGADPKSTALGQDELPGKVNYFIGHDPRRWRTNIPTYGKVTYADVYPGIDLVYYGNQRHLEYDFVVAPGANPDRILLAFDGASKLELDTQGDLMLHTTAGTIRQRKPVIYQEVEGGRVELPGGYMLRDKRKVGFQIAGYDATKPLVIDPVLFYSTYLGGSAIEGCCGIAVDSIGNAYLAGATSLGNFPTTLGAFQPVFGGVRDAYASKLDATGSLLLYSTFLGGSGTDFGFGIAVDATGDISVSGFSGSANFPTTLGAFQTSFGGGSSDAFVTKLSATGAAVFSTYLGGSGSDLGGFLGIATDVVGNVYVAGETSSLNFPTTPGAFQPGFGGGAGDVFVTKMNPLGTGLVYSTYLGGSGSEANGQNGTIALDALPIPNAYVGGSTDSVDFPTTPGAFDTTFNGGASDGFVAKITEAALPPPPTAGKVTGGGTVDVPGGMSNFGFIVESSASGDTGGQLAKGVAPARF